MQQSDSEHSDGHWEDVPSEEENSSAVVLNKQPSPADTLKVTARRRRVTTASSRRNLTPRSIRRVHNEVERESTVEPEHIIREGALHRAGRFAWNYFVDFGALHRAGQFAWNYFIDIGTTMFNVLFWPIVGALFLAFVALLAPSMQDNMRTAFSPLCIIPGVSRAAICAPRVRIQPRRADYPEMMKIQELSFDQLLEDTAGGSWLALEMTKTQLAIGDLVTLVKFSQLTSRDNLAGSLQDFIKDARQTGQSLHRLGAAIGGAVDTIMASNDYALRTIEAAVQKEEASKSLQYVPWPFKPHAPSREAVTKSFAQAMTVLSNQMKRLVIQAQISLSHLERLESRLDTIHSIAQVEDISVASERNELLGNLWTKLGGNRKHLKHHEQLLKNVVNYKTRAFIHVTKALHTLQSMSAQMEELSSHVTAPELIEQELPLEVHIQSIRSGIARLNEGREKAKQREEKVFEEIESY